MNYTRQQIESWRRRDIERDRDLTPQQKIDMTMSLFYLGRDMMRMGIKAQRPDATPDEIDRVLRGRIGKGKRPRAA